MQLFGFIKMTAGPQLHRGLLDLRGHGLTAAAAGRITPIGGPSLCTTHNTQGGGPAHRASGRPLPSPTGATFPRKREKEPTADTSIPVNGP